MDFDLRKPEAEFLCGSQSNRMSKGSLSLAVDLREIRVAAVGQSLKHIRIAVHPFKGFIEWVAFPRFQVAVPLKTELGLTGLFFWIANHAFPVSHLIRGRKQRR